MTTLFSIFSIVLMCIIIAVIYFIWRIMKSSSATWIKITTFFIGIIIILSIIGMLMRFLMIIVFQNSIEQDDTKAIDMDSPILKGLSTFRLVKAIETLHLQPQIYKILSEKQKKTFPKKNS